MKKLLCCLLALILILSLAACGGAEKPSEDPGEQIDPGTEKFEYGTDYINSKLAGDYSISYKVSSTESKEETLTYTTTMIHTSAGYYLSMGGDSQLLFIKNGDSYDMYMYDSENGFEKVDGMTLSEDEVKTQTFAFSGYMTSYAQFEDSLKKVGSQTIAGRSCDAYAFDYSGLGVAMKYEYCIDKATGVCMKFQISASTSEGSGQYTFECTEFLTSGVSLPAYN